jgi:acyl dehydratase
MKTLCNTFSRFYSAHHFKTGDFVKTTKLITQHDLERFSEITGDFNPIHQKQVEVEENAIVHGAYLNAIVAGILGTQLPGHGTIVISQQFSFPNKCYANKEVEIFIELVDVRKIIKTRYQCKQDDRVVFDGEAKLIMTKKL